MQVKLNIVKNIIIINIFLKVLIVLSAAVSMSMAAPNILTHQSTSFGNGPVISHGSVHNHAVAPAVAPVFHGGLVGHGVAGPGLVGRGLAGTGLVGHGIAGPGIVGRGLTGPGLVGHGLASPGLVGHGLAGPGLAVARPGLAVGPAAAVQPVAGGFVHF